MIEDEYPAGTSWLFPYNRGVATPPGGDSYFLIKIFFVNTRDIAWGAQRRIRFLKPAAGEKFGEKAVTFSIS